MKNKKNTNKKSSNKNAMYIMTILFLCVLIYREARIKKNKGNNHYQKKLGPSKLEIQGNIIWSYLHNISVRYIPNDKNKEEMKIILRSVCNYMVCPICGNHWKKILEESDLDKVLENRNNLMLWLCEKHNEINKKLKKEIFECKIDKIIERWG